MADAVKTNEAAIVRIVSARERTNKPWQKAVLNTRFYALIGDIRGRRDGSIKAGQETGASRMARQIVAVPRLGSVA